MPGSKYIFKAVFLILLISLYSCDDNTSSSRFPFEITVTDKIGMPVEGAIVEGGFDWEHFWVMTDSWGRAEVPGFGRVFPAAIKKDNHFSIIVDHLRSGTYSLSPTPLKLGEIGRIKGDLIRFENSRIITINYQGEYRVYSFNGYDISEILMVELPFPVVEFKLFGDELWYTTFQDGIYVYSLADPMNPAELFHLDFYGLPRAFDVKDSLVAVGANAGTGPIRLFAYHTDGTVTELDRIGNLAVRKIYFRSHYLIALNYYSNLYTVFDVADPNDVRFEYQGNHEGYYSPFFYGDTLILEGSGIYPPEEKMGFLMIDMSDPGNPSEIGEFMAEGRIDYIVDDFTAVGRYYLDGDAMSVFKRTAAGDFEAVAMVSEHGYDYHHGSDPPYFLTCERLWKLEKR